MLKRKVATAIFLVGQVVVVVFIYKTFDFFSSQEIEITHDLKSVISSTIPASSFRAM